MTRGVLTELRDVVPLRPLTQNEALRICELQVERLLRLSGIEKEPVPSSVITELPKVQVRYMKPWPVSGCTDWTGALWTIAINAGEPRVRQRFTLAHEFKHVLDNRFIDTLYPDLPSMSAQRRAEAVCDYFAGCLLVPKHWLRAAWTSGVQDPAALARRFDVSLAAIRTRLSQTGLVKPPARCDRTTIRPGRNYYRIDGVQTACQVTM